MDALSVTIMDEIQQANHAFERTFARADAAGLARLYSEGGTVLPSGHEPVSGHQNIAAYWHSAMQSGIREAALHPVEVEQLDDETAIEMGTYRLFGEARQLVDRGKYLAVWKHEGNEWKLHRDIWNSSLPTA
ncbi:nuclear transport factor 2 family protein [Hymenobacter oligotrophus]|uniref:Nuclear transport factor 2 family protein n=1 Tax=Hymenobacter oligotrophus TaxID=2319843 RepID=A0A3B7R5T2_9BACT|nr:nuclear transport factor 2 family protein [Hymenobacter oligotrophus]AYA38710.1 nuclear transport factor 2 family protein [Hymenobacter oligotrophus]